MKGLILNYRTSQVVNFGVLKEALQSGEDRDFKVTTYKSHKIVPLATRQFVSPPLDKVYQILYQKLMRLPNYLTLPYGRVTIGQHIKRDNVQDR